ncbi:hypothetical protein E4U60_001686, partial [Claviceps pazoutovae]
MSTLPIRNHPSTGSAPPGSTTEAIHGPIRDQTGTVHPADRLIVGVDFGTTFSGVAAVYTATPDDIEIIKTWPGGNGITSDKVPTELTYDVPAHPVHPARPVHAAPISSFSSSMPTPSSSLSSSSSSSSSPSPSSSSSSSSSPSPTPKWGFQFRRPEEPRLRCIKLFLDPIQKLPFYVSHLDTAAQLKRANRTVVDAVSDYLTQIRCHTMETLSRRYGASFMASTRVEFVLTCPAVWSDAAKHRTLLAAERAGMGRRGEIRM